MSKVIMVYIYTRKPNSALSKLREDKLRESFTAPICISPGVKSGCLVATQLSRA